MDNPYDNPYDELPDDDVIQPSENILQKAAKMGQQAFGQGTQFDQNHPLQSGINATMGGLKNTPGLGSYMAGHDAKSGVIEQVNPNGGLGNMALDIATDPETLVGGKALFKGIGKVAGKGANFAKSIPGRFKDVVNAPKKSLQLGSEIADIEGQIARSEASSSAPNLAKRGEQIINRANDSLNTEFESKVGELGKQSRDVFAKHSPVAKERFGKLTRDTYDTYGKILDKGEEEAVKRASKEGISLSDIYRKEVIEPTLDTIEKTGARTPTAEKIKKMFQVKEGLSDTALQKTDEAVLNRFDDLSSVEKMKALRSSLYKEGSEDFVQTQYSDLHQKFIGKYSPSVAKANESYGPMKQALRWGGKNIKQFNEHEIKRVTDIVQKANQGNLDETTKAYLNTLKSGRGEFKGSDITKLSEGHQKAVDAISKEIDSTNNIIKKLQSQNLEDIATVRKGGMQSTLDKQNVLQQSAEKKSKISSLKLMKEQVDRDMKTRDDLIRFGIISGLSSLGVGTGVYALARALHEN